jgi:glycosyltransferase involved in cell wall biosynthesis
MAEPNLLIDASRLIWRVWSGRLPTGIDKVCLAYLDHFGGRAQAVVQRGDWRVVLSMRDSQALFALLRQGGPNFRRRLIGLAPGAMIRAREPRRGQVYLNVGHTGLNAPGLTAWAKRTGIRPVYLIHDLIPITHPQFCRDGESARHVQRMANALTSAAGIIANSQATLNDLTRFAEKQELPMPSSLVSWLAGESRTEIVTPERLGRPYFITVGTIEGRKNHVLLLRIWQRLADKLGDAVPLLVIVGQRGWSAEQAIAILDAKPAHIRELNHCHDHKLAGLIAGARALLMPSWAEGFGLPVVEALALGTPVLAHDLPVYRELAGPVPTYVSSNDEHAWEREIMAYTGECQERARQLKALPNLRVTDWPAHFARVEPWLEMLPQGKIF